MQEANRQPMFKQFSICPRMVWPPLVCLLMALPMALTAAIAPALAQTAAKQGSWHVELECRTDSADKGKMTYRLTAEQGLVQPDSKPTLTVSDETLTFPPAPGGGSKVTIIKFLSCDVLFHKPDLTCDSVTVRLFPTSDTRGVAAKPALHFRPDFLGSGFAIQLKIPRGFHYVTGSAQSSRVRGLMPAKSPRKFIRSPKYAASPDPATPHLLTVVLPAPEPRALGTGFEAPYGVEFALAPD